MNTPEPANDDRLTDAAPSPAVEIAVTEKQFPCRQCGAKLVYKAGTAVLTCEYCGFENPIPQSTEEIQELDFRAWLASTQTDDDTTETLTVACTACGATFERGEHATAFPCPFCGRDIVAAPTSSRRIRPRSLLPFDVSSQQVRALFSDWIRSLWFAPNALRKQAFVESRMTGVYVPYWTYDCNATTRYEGQRGDDYWETETYTTFENGRSVTRTRQVRRTRWTYVSGIVFNAFDDVLVLASRSLPTKMAERLEPWDLAHLVPYTDEYLSGYRAESYQVDLAEGFEIAQGIMEPTIRQTICADIGGDHQRIDEMRTQHDNISFKHLLLPIWICAYRYMNRTYRFLVNARTGEVQGERPWSWVKITLLVLFILAIIGIGVYVYTQNAHSPPNMHFSPPGMHPPMPGFGMVIGSVFAAPRSRRRRERARCTSRRRTATSRRDDERPRWWRRAAWARRPSRA